uniref:Uncharacterized protein n=1 Tax=Tetraselmis chuii TaxID=63592 RepID=A0A7S1T060_9CHLO|mmetsp:Transcript_34896/g.62215  ORF Transcript_34896/g.62215 Transcript_34896/m.62215 type:complete len:400 (+) Transcript_34896:1-1200(+)
MLARQAEKSRALGRQEAEASMQERLDALAAQLEQRTTELTAAQEDVEEMQAQLEAAGVAEELAVAVEGERAELRKQLEKARAEVVEARATSEAAAKEAAEHRATAAERTKKFAVLQAQYKKKEKALHARLEAAESAVEGTSASAGEAAEAVRVAEEARAQAEVDRDALLLKLEEVERKMVQVDAKLAAQVEEGDAAVAKVAELQASLEAAQVSAKAAEASKQSDDEHFERMVAAEVAAHMQNADKRVAEAQEEVAALLEQMKTLEGRAQQAENAKIEMSLVLAQLDEGANMSKPISGLPVGARAELLQEVSVKAEEAELAAAVSTRRAQTAEAELAEARAQLAEMEQRAKELGWQVKMLSEPNTIGGAASQSTGSGGGAGATRSMFDMFGCGGVRPAPR